MGKDSIWKGQAVVANQAQHPVVILYEHALLGEGIARYVLAQIGVEATVVSARDLEAVKSVLTLDPAVVIFELSEALRQISLSTLAPHAVLIDVSAVVTRGPAVSSGASGLDRILQAVRSTCAVSRTA
jgi:DNA-binding NarL/FixJ family response regulator